MRKVLFPLLALLVILTYAHAVELYYVRTHWGGDHTTCVTMVLYGEDAIKYMNDIRIVADVQIQHRYVPKDLGVTYCDAKTHEFKIDNVASKEYEIKPTVAITPCVFDPESGKWVKGVKIEFCADWQKDVFTQWKQYLSAWIPPKEDGIVLYDQRWYDTPYGTNNKPRDICDALTETGEYLEKDRIKLVANGQELISVPAEARYSLTPISRGCEMMGTLKKLAIPTAGQLQITPKTWEMGDLGISAPYLVKKSGEVKWCVKTFGELDGTCSYNGYKCYNKKGFGYVLPDRTTWYRSEIPINSSAEAVEWCKENGGTVEYDPVTTHIKIIRSNEFCTADVGCHRIEERANGGEYTRDITARDVFGGEPTPLTATMNGYDDSVAPTQKHCKIEGATFKGGYLCVDPNGQFAILSKEYYSEENLPVCPLLKYSNECAKLELQIASNACNPPKKEEISKKLLDECGKTVVAPCQNPSPSDCKVYLPLTTQNDWKNVMDKCIKFSDFRQYLIDYLKNHGDDEVSWAIYNLIREYNAMFDIAIEVKDGKIVVKINGNTIAETESGEIDSPIGKIKYNNGEIEIVDGNATAKYTSTKLELRAGTVYVNNAPVGVSPKEAYEKAEKNSGEQVHELLLAPEGEGATYEAKLDSGRIIRIDAEKGEVETTTESEQEGKSGGISWVEVVAGIIVALGVGAFIATKKGII